MSPALFLPVQTMMRRIAEIWLRSTLSLSVRRRSHPIEASLPQRLIPAMRYGGRRLNMLKKLLLATATIALVASPASARYRHHHYRHFSYGYGRPAYGYRGYGYPAYGYSSYGNPYYGYGRPNYVYSYPNYGYSRTYGYSQGYSPYRYNSYQGNWQRRGGDGDDDSED
jgi:hypothetical protein